MKMVQVSSEANASPIMTALTRISADKNIDQGDNSRSEAGSVLSDLALGGAAASGAGDCAATGACGRGAAGV